MTFFFIAIKFLWNYYHTVIWNLGKSEFVFPYYRLSYLILNSLLPFEVKVEIFIMPLITFNTFFINVFIVLKYVLLSVVIDWELEVHGSLLDKHGDLFEFEDISIRILCTWESHFALCFLSISIVRSGWPWGGRPYSWAETSTLILMGLPAILHLKSYLKGWQVAVQLPDSSAL